MTDELRKFFEFDEIDVQIKQTDLMNTTSPEPSKRSCYLRGALDQHARTAEVVEAMIECVEAVEFIAEDRHENPLLIAQKALANLRAKLEGK